MDFALEVPSSGYWGVRTWQGVSDVAGGGNLPFPQTHNWVSNGLLRWEKRRYADGSETHVGDSDALGFAFVFRGVEGPPEMPDIGGDWAWAWTGDIGGPT